MRTSTKLDDSVVSAPTGCEVESIMNKQDIQILYDYNRWANARTLDASAKLTQEQFTRDLSGSHRSVRDTLTHILAAEWVWLMRWRGVSPKALFDPCDFPTSLRCQQDGLRSSGNRWISSPV